MAFNGSGVFQRLYSWTNDKAASIKVRADRMDNEMDGMATGLSTCITKDGQTTITANIPFSGRKITGYGSSSTPNSRTDVPSLGQAQDGTLNWVDGGGTADAITAAYSPAITALIDGQICNVRATAANATTTPTFSPNGLTARTIVKNGGQALVAGDIYGDGHQLQLRYDLSNTRWELMNSTNPAGAVTASSSTVFTNKTLTGNINGDTKRVTSAFNSTSDVILNDITDLTWSLVAGTYEFSACLTTTSGASAGLKIANAYSGTTTSYVATTLLINTAGALALSNRTTTIGNSVGTGDTTQINSVFWEGVIVVSDSGTFSFQAAQQTSSLNTTSVNINSKARVTRIA